jgi:PAS domain S-box-containing protein
LVAELGGDGVIVRDDAGYVVFADARAEAFFGHARADLEGMRVADLLAASVSVAAGATPTRAVTDAPDTHVLVDARRADGSVRAVMVATKSVTTRRGRFHVLTVREQHAADQERAGSRSGAAGPGPRVLVVGPLDVRPDSVLAALDASGFDTLAASDASEAVATLESEPADVVVVERDLSTVALFEILRALKAAAAVPVIVVSANAEEDERVGALRLGADDYVTKPFSVAELAERIRVVVRRSSGGAVPETMHFGDLVIELDARRVTIAGRDAVLSPIEFDLLVFLARTPRHVFSRDELLRQVWGSRADWQTQATVTEHVRRLRRKIEPTPNAPRRIITVQRAGYRFDP